MLKENMRPIGHILKLLKISYTELASVIFVERTVVNKWALGKRSFNSSSKHYNNVVDYIIKVNENKNKKTLENFFNTIYPNISKTDSYVRDCLDRFLSSTDMPYNCYGLVNESKNNMFYYNVPIYGNTFGRFSALMQLLDNVIMSDKKEKIILYDNKQFEWIINNDNYSTYFYDKISQILKKEHNIIVISDVHYLEKYHRFSTLMQRFHVYKNLIQYFYISNRNPQMIYSHYLVKGKTIIIGTEMSNGELYTIVLSDIFSVSAAEERIKHQLKHCSLFTRIQNDKERFRVLDNICIAEKTDDLTYLYTPALSFITMSRDLLCKVLQRNKVIGEKKEQILKLHDNHYAISFCKTVTEPQFRQICYLENIKDILSQDEWCLEELSALIGKRITITNEIGIQHIKDTIDLLNKSSNFSIGFLRVRGSNYKNEYTCLCRNNQYLINCQIQSRITHEIYIVNEAIKLMDYEWHNHIPSDYKNNNEVTKKLKQLIENK